MSKAQQDEIASLRIELEGAQKRIAAMDAWLDDLTFDLRCQCSEGFTSRFRHAPECRQYVLDNLDAHRLEDWK